MHNLTCKACGVESITELCAKCSQKLQRSGQSMLNDPIMVERAAKICFHYGHMVNSEQPVVGVSNFTSAVMEEAYSNHTVDLGYVEHKRECKKRDHSQCGLEDAEIDALIGGWRKTYPRDRHTGKRTLVYVPDESSEYSAHVTAQYVLVHWSRHRLRVALCSPCYAGCGDLQTRGDFLAFALPPDMRDEEKAESEPEPESIAEAQCPACNAINQAMGGLGNLMHYRCRDCGMDYSRAKG